MKRFFILLLTLLLPTTLFCNPTDLDKSFSSDGYQTTSIGSQSKVYASTIQPDNKILVAGYAEISNIEQLVLARYLTNGSLDTSFGSTGYIKSSIAPRYISMRLFTNGVITNNSEETILVTFYGTVNNSEDTALNNPAISIPASESIPVLKGAQSISATFNNTIIFPPTPITFNYSYIINFSTDENARLAERLTTDSTRSLNRSHPEVKSYPQVKTVHSPIITEDLIQKEETTKIIETTSSSTRTPSTLTNNYTTTATNINFYTASNNLISTVASLPSSQNTTIPSNATSITTTDLGSTLTIPVSGSASSNLFTNATITNNATQTVTVMFYGTVNGISNTLLNTPAISLYAEETLPIITGATAISIMINNTIVIYQTTISANTSYFINNFSGLWALSTYASSATLTNNGTQNATNLSFYTSNNSSITTPSSLAPDMVAMIPSNATKVSCNDLNSTITIPVSGSTSSNIFGSGTITNNAGQTAEVNFYGTVNGEEDTLLNSPGISLQNGTATPIITGASSISVTSNGQTVISNQIINPNSSYYINDWSFDTYSSIIDLTNNYTQNATNITFYDKNNTALATKSSFPANSSIAAPIDSVYATFNDLNSTLTIPLHAETYAIANAIALQSDGKIVITGGADEQMFIARYNSDGTLDTTFNLSGVVPGTLTLAIGSTTNANAIAVQSDGKIVVTGSTIIGEVEQIFIARFSENGILDRIFNANGIVPGVVTLQLDSESFGKGIALQSDNKIVIAGYSLTSSITKIVVARYNSNGTLDTTFNTTGYINQLIGTSCRANALIIQPNDKIIIAGAATIDDYELICVARYTTAGALDTSFNTQGYITTLIGTGCQAYAITTQQDQKIVVSGYALESNKNKIAVVRYTPTGTLDTTFDPAGYVTTEIGNNAKGYAVNVQPDKKIVVAGFGTVNNALQVALVRYLGNVLPQQSSSINSSTTSSTTSKNSYGTNATYLSKFLYINFFANSITDLTTKAAVITEINSILSAYVTKYTNQPTFNYISHLYLLDDELETAQTTLSELYPHSTEEIDAFFNKINKRITNLSSSNS